jgi:hypothetical protein
MMENNGRDYSNFSVFHYLAQRYKHNWGRYALMVFAISTSVSILTIALSLLFGLYFPVGEMFPTNLNYYLVRISENEADVLAWWLFISASLIVISSTTVIANTIRASIWQSRKEISILKSIGLTNREVGKIYAYEALWLSFTSWFIGLFSGLIISNQFLNQFYLNGAGAMFFAPSSSGLGIIIITFIVTLLISFIGSRRSVGMASRLDPITMIQ